MLCSLEELRSKEVIDIRTGERLGYIDDVRFDTDTAEVKALLIYGGYKLFGLLGRDDDTEIPCGCIEVIGSDVVLVDRSGLVFSTNIRKNGFKNLFG